MGFISSTNRLQNCPLTNTIYIFLPLKSVYPLPILILNLHRKFGVKQPLIINEK